MILSRQRNSGLARTCFQAIFMSHPSPRLRFNVILQQADCPLITQVKN
jgi:hypothetical protein